VTDIPTIEPVVVTAGDTWKWKRSLADYPASGGWSLRYVLASPTQRYTFDSSADGDDHLVSRATGDTDDIVPGRYQWTAFARNGTERYQVGAGTLEVRPNVEGARPWDARTHARKVLEAIEAVLEDRATKDQEEYTIGDRSLKRTPIKDLMVLRDTYRLEVQREEATAAMAAGLPNPRMAGIRFNRV
jgi:hypothetical protein